MTTCSVVVETEYPHRDAYELLSTSTQIGDWDIHNAFASFLLNTILNIIEKLWRQK